MIIAASIPPTKEDTLFTIMLMAALSPVYVGSDGATSDWTTISIPRTSTKCVIRPVKTPGGTMINIEMTDLTVEAKRLRLQCDGKTFDLVASELGIVYSLDKAIIEIHIGSTVRSRLLKNRCCRDN